MARYQMSTTEGYEYDLVAEKLYYSLDADARKAVGTWVGGRPDSIAAFALYSMRVPQRIRRLTTSTLRRRLMRYPYAGLHMMWMDKARENDMVVAELIQRRELTPEIVAEWLALRNEQATHIG